MTRKGLIFLTIGIFSVALVYFLFIKDTKTSAGEISPEAYAQQIKTERAEKDSFFKTNSESPFTDKNGFKGLSYFPADLTYRVEARLEPFADKTQKMVVQLSDGSEEVYEKYAHAVFSLGGDIHRLLIVKQKENYSILFKDATSGHGTYGGGRYIDLASAEMTGSQAIIDFNAAYNPYCAYNPNYACPLPPAENTLSIPVKAGERYVEH